MVATFVLALTIAIPSDAAGPDPALGIAPGSAQGFHDTLADGRPCSFCPDMVVAPAGSFTMGSSQADIDALIRIQPNGSSLWLAEAPAHRVTIQRPFAVGRFAVTFAEWDRCVADGGCNGYSPDDRGAGRGRRPVHVSWHDAKAYAAWLSSKTGNAYRLLSEAEREYVTRAGTITAFWWGPSISPGQANYDGNFTYPGGANGEYRERSVTVDSFAANHWGLGNVHGNIFDWVEDCWHTSYVGAPADGTEWVADCVENDRRVVRGGAWNLQPWRLRSAARSWFSYINRSDVLGFRLARALQP